MKKNTKINKLKFNLLILAGIMLFNVSFVQAQDLKINPANSTITIYGTSNIHDWDCKVAHVDGECVVNGSRQIQSLVVNIPVISIKSGDKLMDKKTYETFDAVKNPNIIFRLTEPFTPQLTGEKDVQVTLTGNLVIAGVTKKVSFNSTGKLTGAGVYQFKASLPLKMTDFNMKPPTAMLGMIKSGDEVTLKFDVTIMAQNLLSLN